MRLTRRSLIAGSATLVASPLVRPTAAQGPSWTLLDDGSGPAARWDHAMLADAAASRLFVFGGRDGDGVALGDAWVFDLTDQTWRPVEHAGPSPRFGSAASAIPDGSGFQLFGGQSADAFFNDLWHFDFGSESWTLLDDGSGSAPSPRYGLGGDFDASGRFIVSHGFTFEGRFDDTWAFDVASSRWSDISPAPEERPLRRCLHEVLAVGDRAELLLYAGCSSGYGPCPQGDLWVFDASAQSWLQKTAEISPAARSNPAMALTSGGVVLVGGLTESGPVADVWVGQMGDSGFTWQEIPGASGVVTPRSSHDMVMLDGAHFLFGGLSTTGVLGDLWRLDDIA